MGFTPVFEVRKKAWSILRDSIQYSYPSMLSERCFTLDVWMWISSKSGGSLICGLVFFEGIKDRYRCFIVHLGQFIRDCVIHSRCFTCPSCSGQTIQPIALGNSIPVPKDSGSAESALCLSPPFYEPQPGLPARRLFWCSYLINRRCASSPLLCGPQCWSLLRGEFLCV